MFFRKLLTFAGYGLAGLVLLLLAGAGAVYGLTSRRLQQGYAIEPRPVPTSDDAAVVAHGRHIAVTRACADCHAEDFGGKRVVEDPLVGRLHGPNLTRGRGGLPAAYSDSDYVRAIRHGVTPEGRPLVLMPSLEYTQLSDEDLGALISYLRTLPPVDRDRGPVELGPLGRVLLTAGKFELAAERIDHVSARPVAVEPAATADNGRYLAASCTGCHGPNFAGGKIAGAPPDWPAAANLTGHAGGALNGWTEADFFRVLRERTRPDGSTVHPVMPNAYAHLTDVETKALWAFLQTVPAAATGER